MVWGRSSAWTVEIIEPLVTLIKYMKKFKILDSNHRTDELLCTLEAKHGRSKNKHPLSFQCQLIPCMDALITAGCYDSPDSPSLSHGKHCHGSQPRYKEIDQPERMMNATRFQVLGLEVLRSKGHAILPPRSTAYAFWTAVTSEPQS